MPSERSPDLTFWSICFTSDVNKFLGLRRMLHRTPSYWDTSTHVCEASRWKANAMEYAAASRSHARKISLLFSLLHGLAFAEARISPRHQYDPRK